MCGLPKCFPHHDIKHLAIHEALQKEPEQQGLALAIHSERDPCAHQLDDEEDRIQEADRGHGLGRIRKRAPVAREYISSHISAEEYDERIEKLDIDKRRDHLECELIYPQSRQHHAAKPGVTA